MVYFQITSTTPKGDAAIIDVGNVQNVLYHFWKERVLFIDVKTLRPIIKNVKKRVFYEINKKTLKNVE